MKDFIKAKERFRNFGIKFKRQAKKRRPDAEESLCEKTTEEVKPVCFTEAQAAIYVNMSRSFLRIARMNGSQPNFVRHKRTIRYLKSDLDRWLQKNRVVQHEDD